MSFESLSRKGQCRCGLAFPNHSMPFLSAASSYHFVGGCITEEKIANEGTIIASGLCQGDLMWSYIFVTLSSKGLVVLAGICRCGVCCILCAFRDLKGEMSAKKERFRSRGQLSEREKPDIFSFRNISTSQKSWVMKAFHCIGRAEMLQSKWLWGHDFITNVLLNSKLETFPSVILLEV